MNIDKTIESIDLMPNDGTPPLKYAGPIISVASLKELVRQRNELLKAAKDVVEISREGERYQIIVEGIEPLDTVIKSCE